MKFLPFYLMLLSLIGVALSKNSTDLSWFKTSSSVSVSGISSGGAMAVQMVVAHSSIISGAGIFAAPPYFCARGILQTALDCMTTGFSVYPTQLKLAAEGYEALGLIDKLSNLIKSKIYFFSGKRDSVVWSGIVKKSQKFFEKLGADVKTEYDISAEHTFPTDFFGNACSKLKTPYIGNCDYDGAKHSLEHILDRTLEPKVDYKDENLYTFSQEKYKIGLAHSLGESGLIYVPDNCKENECDLHIAFHG